MGAGIAQVSAQSGYRTFVCDVDEETVRSGIRRIEDSLEAGVERGKLSAVVKDAAMSNLIDTTNLGKMSECDLVIEAVVEDLSAKRKVFLPLSRSFRRRQYLPRIRRLSVLPRWRQLRVGLNGMLGFIFLARCR